MGVSVKEREEKAFEMPRWDYGKTGQDTFMRFWDGEYASLMKNFYGANIRLMNMWQDYSRKMWTVWMDLLQDTHKQGRQLSEEMMDECAKLMTSYHKIGESNIDKTHSFLNSFGK